MTKPLAILYYERLMPGSQLFNRLQDLSYRVLHVGDPSQLRAQAEKETPLIILMDLSGKLEEMVGLIKTLKANKSTVHIPILGFADRAQKLHSECRQAGVALVAMDDSIIPQLPQLLDQVLHVD